MEIVFEVPAEKAEFMLELLRSIRFVKNPRRLRVRKASTPMSDTEKE